jgi:hypothetical protein
MIGVVVFFFLLIIFSISCVHKKDLSDSYLKSVSLPYVVKDSQESVLQYQYFDVESKHQEGPVWTPLILPLAPRTILQESDFFLGYANGDQDPLFSPHSGSCRILPHIQKEPVEAALHLVKFISAKEDPSQDKNALFFLLHPENQKPFAIVRLDGKGSAKCFLPFNSYFVSTGFGQLRKEVFFEAQSAAVKQIYFSPKVLLKIDPLSQTGVKTGDLIRIGRNFSEENLEKLSWGEEKNKFLIPSQIKNDIYVSGNFQTNHMGVQEYFISSILVGEQPFYINLEPANYVFAVLRKNKLMCLVSLNLRELQNQDILKCPDEENFQDDFEDTGKSYFFDATVFPFSFLESKQFHKWIFASQNYALFSLKKQMLEETLDLSKRKFTFIFENKDDKNSSILPFYFQENHFENKKYHQFKMFYLFADDLKIPIGGVGEEKLAQGGVPFSYFTKISSLSLKDSNFLIHSQVQVSNGAVFYLFEPLSFAQDAGILTSYMRRQRFRFRISIPPWNPTRVIEMYVNGKVYRRWILERRNLSQAFSRTFEEEMIQDESFLVHWVAFGERVLPDFLTGLPNALPFAITRDYCIDISGTGVCRLEQKK